MVDPQATPTPAAGPGPTPGQPLEHTGAVSNEEKNWATFTHLSALSGVIIPLGMIIGPLVMWLIGKDKYASIDAHGKEALNFNITIAIAMVVSVILILVVIGILMLIAVGITWLVLVIMATIKVSQGEFYRYPFSLRLVK